MPGAKPDPNSLAAKLGELKKLHDLQKTPPEIREAQIRGFWWFMCLCSQEMNWYVDKPDEWAKLLKGWNEEAQANFEATYNRQNIPFLVGSDPRNN